MIVENAPNRGFFYIIKSGNLKVSSEHRLRSRELSSFAPGDSFGLVSAMTRQNFLVTIFAENPAEILQIPIRMLGEYLVDKRDIVMKILSHSSRELKAIHRTLSRLNLASDREFHPSRLFAQGVLFLEREHFAEAAASFRSYLSWHEKGNPVDSAEQAKQYLGRPELSLPERKPVPGLSELPEGSLIFVENEDSRDLYVIQEGSVSLSRMVRGNELLMDVLGSGEIFGEMAMIDQEGRMATARAVTDVKLFCFPGQQLETSVGASLLQKIFESLARRIWFNHQRLVILRIAEPSNRLYAMIYNLLRDHEIKAGGRLKTPETVLPLNLEELQQMSGIFRVAPEKIESFTRDPNLELGKHSITVKNRKRIEDKVAFYRTHSGQISAGST